MTKVLILGGGLGGVSAAWALSRTPALRAQFQITLVQPGWRLGGKGASGRAASGRIHEHGLHMFMGWYELSFYMLREVYDELQNTLPNPAARPFRRAGDAFLPLRELKFGRPGTLDYWTLPFRERPGHAGDDPNGTHPGLLDLAVRMIQSIHGRLNLIPAVVPAGTTLGVMLGMLDSLSAALVTAALPPKEAHEARVLIDIGTAGLRGIIKDGLAEYGVQPINLLDFREWLLSHGATRESLDSSLIKALYDLAFAYPGGDETNPRMEAGSMLLAAMRMGADYKDAPVFRMRAGMGDVVFAPLYEVLQARGVNFQFFHRAKGITLTPDKLRIATVDVQKQMDLAPGVTAYAPLQPRPYGGKLLPTWPDEPDWVQLSGTADPHALEFGGPEVAVATLQNGVDFDEVILAIPLGGDLGATLAADSPRWARMRSAMKTVATQSLQVWTMPSLAAMGWSGGPTVVAGFVPPLSDWADMSHLLLAENAVGPTDPQGILYFCGVAEDLTTVAPIYDGISDWFDAHGGAFWPSATEPAGFAYSKLQGGDLAHQYVRLNRDGSERYVLSVPGSTGTRISPGDTGFLNLSVAGDWVHGAINGGCAEAAVQGGLDAADAMIRRITGAPRPDYPLVP